ncbi:ABC transporter substrate-binding protein [Candidatus Electrothrix sp.]|uniref:ABC transporter substrate-binding protein n=1 Tax=Candidatus Electrothrix sp. TaxID=2170559 RepID=UPI00405636D6
MEKKEKRNNLRILHYAFLLMGILLSAGCSGEDATSSAERLIVYDWSMADLPDFHSKFLEKYPNTPPKIVYLAEDVEAYGKIKAGFAFDIVHPCTQFFQLYVENGLILPLDTSRIERWNDLEPSFADMGNINGKQYVMPYDWGYESIVVRTDKVKEIPDSWEDLWDPQYKGHVSLIDAADPAQVFTSLILGFDPWNTTSEQDEEIQAKLSELKDNIFTYWTDFNEIQQLIASGDSWISANVWPETYAMLNNKGLPVKYITPKEGMIGWMCGYAISSKTKNLDMAYDYLNALLDPTSHAAYGNMGAGVSSKAALSLMDQEQVKLMNLDQLDLQNRTVFYKSWTEEQRKKFTERWNQFKAAP